jgi:aspartokinase/homoserine dehydrogenase 1
MKVLKFGGTSVGSIESIIRVISIIEDNLAKGEKIVVVYSAMGGVTNRLIDIAKMAAAGNEDYREMMKAMEERHFATIRGLIGAKSQSTVFTGIKILFNDLEDILRGTSLIRELTPRTLDLVMSFGERLSTTIVTEALKFRNVKAEYCDARSIIRTNSGYGNAEVDFETSNKLIQEKFASTEATLCITGFIGATAEGITTTLGRGGSDFTASIIGAALDAELIEIWTDVDGIMTADPRKVPNSFTIPTLSYAEAMELSHFGAKVIYPPSLQPAFAKDIPLKVLNTFNTDFEGSLVCRKATNKKYDITGISSIDELALVNIQGSGMIGVAGISSKLFEALSRNQISVVLISQASSEHSICFAIDPRYIDKAKEVLHETFKEELESGYVDGIEVSRNLSVIAIVGEGMKKSAGISGKLFSVLGKNGINIIAIAQGSSELNISVVISKNDLSKALNAIHGVFFQSEIRNLNLYMVGAGLIGGTLIEQIRQQTEYLQNEKMLRLNIVGISNTKKMLLDPAGISPETWREDLDIMGVKTSLPAFIQRVQELNLPNSVFIDCTSDKDIVHSYNDLLKANVSIVTPNKVANSGSYANYETLRKTALNRGVKFLYETNVGAGLPIINTIQGLIASGDQFLKIEAILSGTLSYIFNNFKPGVKFVDVVREAKEKGYTEPDPRDDLSGTDVGRKILILSREIGMRLEPEDIEIIPLLPEACLAAPTVDDFFEELLKNNDYFENLLSEATAQGGVLRYIATLNEGKATVALRTVGADHPFYSLSGSDNIVSFTTERYKDHPLVIKGSGAGAAVTASGVFADIMSISSYLG